MANDLLVGNRLHRAMAIGALVLIIGAIAWATTAWLVGLTAESRADVAGTTATYWRAALVGGLGVALGATWILVNRGRSDG
jgi:hypothetical protein